MHEDDDELPFFTALAVPAAKVVRDLKPEVKPRTKGRAKYVRKRVSDLADFEKRANGEAPHRRSRPGRR